MQVGRCEHIEFVNFLQHKKTLEHLKREVNSLSDEAEEPTSTQMYIREVELSVHDLIPEGRHYKEDYPDASSSDSDTAENNGEGYVAPQSCEEQYILPRRKRIRPTSSAEQVSEASTSDSDSAENNEDEDHKEQYVLPRRKRSRRTSSAG